MLTIQYVPARNDELVDIIKNTIQQSPCGKERPQHARLQLEWFPSDRNRKTIGRFY
jgi:hypothetical protein